TGQSSPARDLLRARTLAQRERRRGGNQLRLTRTRLTRNLSRLHITVPNEFVETLEAVRDALSHGRTRPSMQAALKAGLVRRPVDGPITRNPRKGAAPRPTTGLPAG